MCSCVSTCVCNIFMATESADLPLGIGYWQTESIGQGTLCVFHNSTDFMYGRQLHHSFNFHKGAILMMKTDICACVSVTRDYQAQLIRTRDVSHQGSVQ